MHSYDILVGWFLDKIIIALRRDCGLWSDRGCITPELLIRVGGSSMCIVLSWDCIGPLNSLFGLEYDGH